MRTRIVLPILLAMVALFTLSIVGLAYGKEPGITNPVAFIEVGGGTHPVQVGTRIATKSETTPPAQCPAFNLSGTLTPELNVGHITARIDTDCSITILSATRSYQKAPSPADDSSWNSVDSVPEEEGSESTEADTANSSTVRYGWATSELRDFANWALTKVHAEMFYDDYGVWVLNGRFPKNQCSTAYSLWKIVSCYSSWNPHGPYKVFTSTTGTFVHDIAVARHTHTARFDGTPGRGRYECYQQPSNAPGHLLHWHCKGAYFND